MSYSKEHLSQWVDFFTYNPASRHRRRVLSEFLSPLEFRSVLDVGCGDGSLLGYLKERFGCDVYGLESDDSPAQTRIKLDGYYQADISRQKPDRTFDVVIAAEVLEHIPDHEGAMKNIHALCDRYLLITVPAGPVRATDAHMGHVRHYTLDSLNRLVGGAGFRVVRSFAWGFPFHSTYKALQDVVPGTMIQGFGSGEYGLSQKAVCNLLYGLFFLNVRSRGCQLFLLAEKA
jgi:SAM-dependent methyltransferase